jgi:Peroxisomal biogenesis factor 11 (PEX11)
VQLRDARSVFRLSKSLFEVKRIKLILAQSHDAFAIVISTLSRLCYFFFFLLDNLHILGKLLGVKSEYFMGLSRRCQLVGQGLFLVYCAKTLRRTQTDESDLKVAALNRMTVRDMQEGLQKICALRDQYVMHLVRALCDFAICLNENDIPRRVFGIQFNQGVVGVLGMVSGLMYLYGLANMRQ